MDLLVPSRSCFRKPPLLRQLTSSNYNLNSLKCRRKTVSSGLKTDVGVNGNYSPSVPTHRVTVHDRFRGVVHEFLVPEDQYILHTAESQNITLPFACRHGQELKLPSNVGCCTSCAVRIKSGQIKQPEALGISAELKSKACAITCIVDLDLNNVNIISKSLTKDTIQCYTLVDDGFYL